MTIAYTAQSIVRAVKVCVAYRVLHIAACYKYSLTVIVVSFRCDVISAVKCAVVWPLEDYERG